MLGDSESHQGFGSAEKAQVCMQSNHNIASHHCTIRVGASHCQFRFRKYLDGRYRVVEVQLTIAVPTKRLAYS